MNEITFYVTYLLSFYAFLFLFTALVFAKASENIRLGINIEGFSLGAFNFYITMNILLSISALIMFMVLTRKTFNGKEIEESDKFIYIILLILFLSMTIANSIYLGRIDRYLEVRPTTGPVELFKERRRLNNIPVTKTIVEIFFGVNVFASFFIIFQIAFSAIRILRIKIEKI